MGKQRNRLKAKTNVAEWVGLFFLIPLIDALCAIGYLVFWCFSPETPFNWTVFLIFLILSLGLMSTWPLALILGKEFLGKEGKQYILHSIGVDNIGFSEEDVIAVRHIRVPWYCLPIYIVYRGGAGYQTEVDIKRGKTVRTISFQMLTKDLRKFFSDIQYV